MAWGAGLRSCSNLIDRVERNDPNLVELVILSTKTVTEADWLRLSAAILKHGPARCLTSLQASGHAISSSAAKTLGQAIYQSSLTVPWALVAIGDKNSKTIMNDFVQALQPDNDDNDKTLQLAALDLSYKGLTNANLPLIRNLTKTCQSIKTLNLSRNPGLFKGIDHDEMEQIFCFVETLDVSSNELASEQATALLERLSASSSCQHLNLSHNPIGKTPFDILRLLPSQVMDLNLCSCEIRDESLLNLATTTTTTLMQNLDLSNNSISFKAMEAFASWLASDSCPALATLNLAHNPLMTQGVTTLVQQGIVPRATCRRLQSLDLGETQCGVEGAKIAMETSQVASLRLFKNQLGSQGFTALAPTLIGGHAFLETLDLAANGAEVGAVVTLLRGLLTVQQDNIVQSTLKCIVVGGNQGGEELEDLVQQIKQIWPDLDIARDKVQKG